MKSRKVLIMYLLSTICFATINVPLLAGNAKGLSNSNKLNDPILPHYVWDNYGSTSFGYQEVSSHISKSQMDDYFFNLDENVPFNEQGTCGYVAGAMLLGYYDIYYNNTIVSDSYIQSENYNSFSTILSNTAPGCIEDVSPYYTTSNDKNVMATANQNYHSYVLNNPTDSLQYNLINIGNDLGYISEDIVAGEGFWAALFGTTIYNFGLSINEMQNVVYTYLNNNNLTNLFTINSDDAGEPEYVLGPNINIGNDFTDDYKETCEQIEAEVLSLVQSGYPVLTSINYLAENDSNCQSLEGHAAIAYDYSGNDILYHLGYDDYKHSQLLGDYLITGYLVLEPTTYQNHICSNYYKVGNVSYCSCQLSNHVHEYVKYSLYNNISHKHECYCINSNNYVLESHEMIERFGRAYCKKCPYSYTGGGYVNGEHEHEH